MTACSRDEGSNLKTSALSCPSASRMKHQIDQSICSRHQRRSTGTRPDIRRRTQVPTSSQVARLSVQLIHVPFPAKNSQACCPQTKSLKKWVAGSCPLSLPRLTQHEPFHHTTGPPDCMRAHTPKCCQAFSMACPHALIVPDSALITLDP
jgi:hypothetical protein